MRLSNIAIVYFIMGVVVVSAGVVPVSCLGIGTLFLDTGAGDVDCGEPITGDTREVTANEEAVGNGDEDSDGMLDNLGGPIENALDTVAGGALLAVLGAVNMLVGFYGWPVMVANYIDAPRVVVLLTGVLVASFTFGALRVFRASI